MNSILRAARRPPRANLFTPIYNTTYQQRSATQSYGNDQSGHPQSDTPNPKVHLEHPGPESPASQGKGKSSSASSSSQPQSQSQSSSSSSPASSPSSSTSSRPTIHHPKSAAEENDPEVRKHNEDMRNRHEQSVNQLDESDNKVNKDFWKGDVGDPKKNERSK